MNVREKIINDIYDLVNDEGIYRKSSKSTDEAIKALESFTDSFVDMICEIDKKAFLRGATVVLDLIAGKEVL